VENFSQFLDHVAIAVSDLDKTQKIYEDLGFTFGERETVEDQKVITAFANVDTNAHLELLSPIGNEGPIQKFLDKNGPGIHHLCFRVEDIVKKSEELTSKGYRLLYEAPRVGAGNCLVNFIHPKTADGVLIELSQKLK
jgi:methylmalonyl-CoA/ethylmalonyl-CoA epimerase